MMSSPTAAAAAFDRLAERPRSPEEGTDDAAELQLPMKGDASNVCALVPACGDRSAAAADVDAAWEAAGAAAVPAGIQLAHKRESAFDYLMSLVE